MENTVSYIEKYFELILSNLNKALNSDKGLSEKNKSEIYQRLEVLNELKHLTTWHYKNQDEKQISRIQKLASMRRSDALSKFIKLQQQAIYIYDIVGVNLIYIKALNTSVLDSLIKFCNNLKDDIDFRGSCFDGVFPSNKEIENAFKPYFEITKPAKGNGKMFEECYEKIEYLYDELIKLNETI